MAAEQDRKLITLVPISGKIIPSHEEGRLRGLVGEGKGLKFPEDNIKVHTHTIIYVHSNEVFSHSQSLLEQCR